jgi:hypothetical protein
MSRIQFHNVQLIKVIKHNFPHIQKIKNCKLKTVINIFLLTNTNYYTLFSQSKAYQIIKNYNAIIAKINFTLTSYTLKAFP